MQAGSCSQPTSRCARPSGGPEAITYRRVARPPWAGREDFFEDMSINCWSPALVNLTTMLVSREILAV
jgi:hypothetical protein